VRWLSWHVWWVRRRAARSPTRAPRNGHGSISSACRLGCHCSSLALTAAAEKQSGMNVLPSRTEAKAQPVRAPGQATAMIEIDHVSQMFQTSARQDHLALSEISVTVEDWGFGSILGPSGCGKSTLLYIVGGFVSPTQGNARMKGRAITGPGPDRGPVFQEFALFPWKTVLGNVMYGPRQQGVKPAEADAQSRALLEMVGLKGFENFYPKELSGGMKQRGALPRTLAYHPE